MHSCPSSFGLAHLARGQDAMSHARLAQFRGDPDAEAQAREALVALRAAVDNLDDLPEQFDAHYALDQAGRWVRETFGCSLAQDDKGYARTCPVDLGHHRMGMSVGAVNTVRICMICGEDPRACRHVAGRTYDAPAKRIRGRCNVCNEEACDHAPGEPYPILCTRLITHVDVQEISLVRRPANTAARVFKIGVPTRELEDALGPDGWLPGMPVRCDRCLSPCDGLQEIPEPTAGAPRPGAVSAA